MPEDAKPNETNEAPEEVQIEAPPKAGTKFNIKILLFGVPVFVLQLVVVYYVTANILLARFDSGPSSTKEKNSEVVSEDSDSEDSTLDENIVLGQFVYSVDDVIVNPAGTDGKRLLLTSIGFDVPSKEEMEKLSQKDILIKDMIISTLSEKDIKKLKTWSYKDSLKVEIADKMHTVVPSIKINKVYFSKFIIQ